MLEMAKAYEPQGVEDALYKLWMESGFFNPDNLPNLEARKDVFSIVLPPPNVTGTLHMGHATMLAIEDAMVRFARLQGKRALWIPGTDHAAIATQSKVEKMIFEAEKKTRYDLGREAFLRRVEQFAQESHDTIVNQVKKMGSSVDWSREAYTLDETRNKAVNTAFKRMYDDGLIYRGHRVVNWDPVGQTTIADDEIVYKETTAKLYTFKYGADFPISISTTRPETKVGDMAVAVHPTDKRYKKFIGKTFEVVFAGASLKITIVGDESVDPKFGTGALGVTPAHSSIDFDIAKRNNLPLIQVIGEDAKMLPAAGSLVAGKPVLEARKMVVAWLKNEGLLEDEQDSAQNLSTAERTGGVVEPLPKLQWFVDVNKEFVRSGKTVTLKSLMQGAVRSKKIDIIPDRFEKTYFHWIDNLRDWCISRQIWFGHRVPAYFDIFDRDNAEGLLSFDFDQGLVEIEQDLERRLFEATSKSYTIINEGRLLACSFDQARLLVEWGIVDLEQIRDRMRDINITRCTKPVVGFNQSELSKSFIQDPDTLDTWFSSGLWNFSTLGWPDEQSLDLKRFHPTSVLETGYDILFFWVARMILMSTYLVDDVPFKTVYLHGLVRDEQGRKMSKSLGNIINPLDMIEKYGADATRLSLVLGNTPGNDLKLSEEKIAGFRNFTNKLWNISRFISMKTGGLKHVEGVEPKTLADKWILGSFAEVSRKITERHESFDLSMAGEMLRDFTWSEFADWYLEIAKIEGEKDDILNYILERLLILWHPFMPFVTEEIYKQYNSGLILVAPWPQMEGKLQTKDEKALNELKAVVGAIRNIRAQYKVDQKTTIEVKMIGGAELGSQQAVIEGLTRSALAWVTEKPDQAASAVVGKMSLYVPLAGLVDVAKESARLKKELETTQKYVKAVSSKLNNADFVKNAPEAVVAAEKAKLAEAEGKCQALERELQGLGG